MVIDAFIMIWTVVLSGLAFWLPHFSIWPQSFLDAIIYLLNSLTLINFIFPIDAIFYGGHIFIWFCILYYGVRLLNSIFSYFRGSGNIHI
jgi:hypothetical protein